MNTATLLPLKRKPFGERGDSCEDFGHRRNRHHHHCYHCGRTTGNHRTWCPDGGIAPDAGLSGWWTYNVGCKGD